MAMDNMTKCVGERREILRRVWYTASTAIATGYGVCYDRDYGTATASDAERDNRVSLPDNTNNNSFAGVVKRDYAAKTGGQYIEIAEPGSIVQVYVDASVTIGENTYVTCQIGGGGSGTFDVGQPGFMGRGTARVMQTRTGAGLALCELMGGPESGLVEYIATAVLTAGGAATFAKGGVTVFTGPATPGSDVTNTLADGTYQGMRKMFKLSGALTTNDVLVTVTNGEQLDGTTDLGSMELDGDGDTSVLEFRGTKWRLIQNAGTGLA